MGGNLAITVREPDGKEHRMDRWTNSMPWFIDNIDLVEKKPQHIQKYIKTWYDFCKDWEANKEMFFKVLEEKGTASAFNVPFKHDMTPIYAQHPFLAPSEYGLVVVDMINNVILSLQGYHRFGMIMQASLGLDIKEREHGFWERNAEGWPSESYRLREFFEAGKILKIANEDSLQIEDLPDSQALLEYIKQRSIGHPTWEEFYLDMSPFEIVNFKESAGGVRDLKQTVLDLGFAISDEEEEKWDEFLSCYDDDDDDDDDNESSLTKGANDV
jgi:hypothetical protein